MGSQVHKQVHFVLFPLMAQGHMIPIIDIARLLAQHNSVVSILTTPLNAARFKPILDRATKSGLKIRVFELRFPSGKPGLPQGCENVDMLPSLDMSHNFVKAACDLEQQAFQLFQELNPRPNCIISDMMLPWTINIAKKWGIPRISFIGFSCFSMLCIHNVISCNVLETLTSETEYFTVPGLPDSIQLTKQQFPLPNNQNMEEFNNLVKEAEENSFGLIINTFEELESAYIQEYKKAMGNKKVWCVGPVSLCNKDMLDKAERGNKTSYDEQECIIKWLDSWDSESVIYACLGSISTLMTSQMVELGLGLEASNRPFIWVLRGGEKSKEIEKWISESGFEERVKERGMVIKGWAPQVLILSHPAIGGFLTHCGWNSTLEGISAGSPMVTWPLFADQFCNEKVVVQVIKIGISVGAVAPQILGGKEQLQVLVKKEDIRKGIDRLMEGGEETEERRRRSKQLGEMAKKATEEGGSSYSDIQFLIQDIMRQTQISEQPN